jgi:hypothetical protein
MYEVIINLKMPIDIRKLILYFAGYNTTSSRAIKNEIKRILSIIEQDKLNDMQTLWSIKKIYWFEIRTNEDLFRNININPCAFYDLEIALLNHKDNYSYNGNITIFEKHLRYTSLTNELKRIFKKNYKLLKYMEEYYKQTQKICF